MPSRSFRMLKFSINSSDSSSVMSSGSAATGTPPLSPISAWISGRSVMSMNFSANSALLERSGITHIFPAEPGDIPSPGNRKVDQSYSISFRKRPYHQLPRSEEHTSELQSRGHLVCRLLLEKNKETN